MERLYRGQSRKKRSVARFALGTAVCLIAAACTTAGSGPIEARRAPGAASPAKPSKPEPTPADTPDSAGSPGSKGGVTERPPWLGKRVIPGADHDIGLGLPTPPILRDRRFPTIDILPRPSQPGYRATVGPVERDVLERSTWRPKCPVSPNELVYLTMTFWGFDRVRHTGEMIVNASVAEEVTGAFEKLYAARFPIEEMRVATLEEQRAWHRAPTGDTNLTSSLECRRAAGSDNWSEHAYGLAIDINPFHNPYLLGEHVGPELASAYTDRTWKRPGMIFEGDAVTQAFDAIGWGWGGRWNSLKDWMHFSQSGG